MLPALHDRPPWNPTSSLRRRLWGHRLLLVPATMSLLILMNGLYAWWLVVARFALNLLPASLVFVQSNRIMFVLGQRGLEGRVPTTRRDRG